jgi:hypothetical protein
MKLRPRGDKNTWPLAKIVGWEENNKCHFGTLNLECACQ